MIVGYGDTSARVCVCVCVHLRYGLRASLCGVSGVFVESIRRSPLAPGPGGA